MKMAIPMVILSLAMAGCAGKNIRNVQDTNVIDLAEETGVPTWYIEPQPDNEEYVYATGTGLAVDIQFSMDKAYHQAKVGLGDKLSAVVSSEMISTISDSSSQSQKISKSGYEGIDVSKYKVVNKVVFKEGEEKYRTYVLLRIRKSEAIVLPFEKSELEDEA
jgi:hypothetical protein